MENSEQSDFATELSILFIKSASKKENSSFFPRTYRMKYKVFIVVIDTIIN